MKLFLCVGYHCQEGNPVPQPCELGHYCPNTDLSGYGPQPCPRLHYRDDLGAEQVFYSAIRCYIVSLCNLMESNPPDSADMQSDTKVAILHLGILRRIFKNGMINVAQNPEIGY